MRKPFLFSLKFNIPNVAALPIQKKNPGSFHKKQDLPGVPKIVKNDPKMFQNSCSILIVL